MTTQNPENQNITNLERLALDAKLISEELQKNPKPPMLRLRNIARMTCSKIYHRLVWPTIDF